MSKDETFGWLPEIAQRHLFSLTSFRFERVFLLHIRSLQKPALCLLVFHKSIRSSNMPPHLSHIVPIRVQSLARVFKYHGVPLCLSVLLQAQSLSCCCHLLFTLLLWSYKNTILDGSCSCQGFSTFPFILHISLVLSLVQICKAKSGSEAFISLWELVSDSSQFWQSSIAIIVVLDSRALAYLPKSIHLLFHGSKNGVILNVD